MNVKKLSLTLAINAALIAGMAAAVPLANAQDQTPTTQTRSDRQPPSPEKVVDRMAAKLNLSEDQKQQILPIIADRQQKMQALRSQDMRRRAKRHEMKSIMEESDKKIGAVLNDQQKEQYAQMKKEMREERKARHHNR